MNEPKPELFFDIGHSIGHGGQADVYLVRLRSTGGVYAGKFLREAWDPMAREQFRNEALRQNRIAGKHVVPIIAWNLHAEQPFLILEYMPHGSLADEVVRRGTFAPTEALATMRELAVALAELHARGVVHRDMKPGNVLRGADGRWKLNDFGFAATMTFAEYVRAPGFVGTPAYAAPEQSRGLCSPKSDVFALGVILYELLIGVPGPRTTRLSQVLGPAARQIDILVDRMCAVEVALRPSSADVVGLIDEALRLLQTANGPASLPGAPGPKPQWPQQTTGDGLGWLLGAFVLVGAVALLSDGGSTWDSTVGRFRGPNGQFKA
jgi:serine/threonine protein kinase